MLIGDIELIQKYLKIIKRIIQYLNFIIISLNLLTYRTKKRKRKKKYSNKYFL